MNQKRVFRVSASVEGRRVLSYFKFSVEGNEVYVHAGGGMHLSVHSSGQVHIRLDYKVKQDLHPLRDVETETDWLHAVRFRLIPRVGRFLIPVDADRSDGSVLPMLVSEALVLDLLICGKNRQVPQSLAAAEEIWNRSRKDGRVARLLLGREPHDALDRGLWKYIDDDCRLTLGEQRRNPTAELLHIRPTAIPNVVRVTNAPQRALRFGDSAVVEYSTAVRYHIEVVSGVLMLTAPDGAVVGTVTVTGSTWDVSLKLGESVPLSGLAAHLSIAPEALIQGQSFKMAPSYVDLDVRASGVERAFRLQCRLRFDGRSVKVRLAHSSCVIRSVGLLGPMMCPALEDLLVSFPSQSVELTADPGRTSQTSSLESIVRRLPV